jgi:hypothetical protein
VTGQREVGGDALGLAAPAEHRDDHAAPAIIDRDQTRAGTP